MKPILTEWDVHEAIRGANGAPGLFNHSITAFLNQRIETRRNAQLRRYGTWLEAIGVIGVLAGLTLLWGQDMMELGLLATVGSFVVGLVGYGMGEPR